MTDSRNDLHLPWDAAQLETLLRKAIPLGEASKVDCKRDLDISGVSAQGELLKDISAIANTYDHAYENHGFIIFGASGGGLTYATFDRTPDHLQATIDDLVKRYLDPFVRTHLCPFGTGSQSWATLVIPPTRNAPHVFLNDIHKRHRGDIYVRRGTTTDKAMPNDFARFFAQHLDGHAHDQYVVIRELRSRLSAVEQANSGAAPDTIRATDTAHARAERTQPQSVMDAIDEALARQRDGVMDGLSNQAQRIQAYLASEVPWSVRASEKEDGEALLEGIEAVSDTYWKAVSRLAYYDKAGQHDEAILKSLALMAERPRAPAGETFNPLGEAVRYYPLATTLYVVFIAGIAARRTDLLRRCLEVPLETGSEFEEPQPISTALFHVRDADLLFQTRHPSYPHQKWCDPLSARVRKMIEDVVAVDDPTFNKRRTFFQADLLLALTPLNVEKGLKPWQNRIPAPGAYLYYSDARAILARFLSKEARWIESLFTRPLRDILVDFDRTAPQLAASGCVINGFAAGASDIAYPPSTA